MWIVCLFKYHLNETREYVFYFQFKGIYHFKYPINELVKDIQALDDLEIQITATVGERFYDEIIEGYSIARFFNSSVKIFFLGSSYQVFKPMMPYTVYVRYKNALIRFLTEV